MSRNAHALKRKSVRITSLDGTHAVTPKSVRITPARESLSRRTPHHTARPETHAVTVFRDPHPSPHRPPTASTAPAPATRASRRVERWSSHTARHILIQYPYSISASTSTTVERHNINSTRVPVPVLVVLPHVPVSSNSLICSLCRSTGSSATTSLDRQSTDADRVTLIQKTRACSFFVCTDLGGSS